MRRRLPFQAAFLALLLVAGACTATSSTTTTTVSGSSSDPTNTGASTTTTAEPQTTSTSTTEPPEPLPTTTTTTLAPPRLPDTFELAVAALRDIEGFTYVDEALPNRRLDELEFRIGSLLGDLLANYSWGRLDAADGTQLVAVSLYPATPFRADPELDFGIALSASNFDDPIETRIGDNIGWHIEVDGERWTFVGDNTHVFLVIGEADPAEQALELLLAANGPGYLWEEGDCLYFEGSAVPYAPFGEGELVPCSGSHTHEVIWSTVLEAGPGARYPGDALSDESFERCEVAYEGFMGSPEFPSQVAMIRYLPDFMEWDEGDRYLACVVYVGDRTGDPIATADSLRDRGPEFRRDVEVGQCSDLAGGPGVRCSRPHAFEYLGTADLSLPAGDYPGSERIANAANDACGNVLADYAESLRNGDAQLEAFAVWFPGPAAWGRGDRFAHCLGWALDDEGEVQLVMGSMAGEWTAMRPPRGGGLDA